MSIEATTMTRARVAERKEHRFGPSFLEGVVVDTQEPTKMFVVANGITRAEVDRLREQSPDLIVNRNRNGTYRVTRPA